jgi:hypothetical protein
LIDSQHFSMVLLWGQLQRDFLRFANCTSSSRRYGNFYQVAQGQHPLSCAFPTAGSLSCPKKYRVDMASHNISESTLFKLFKSMWVDRRRDVQLIPQEIDTASRLFCAHSADMVKSYL